MSRIGRTKPINAHINYGIHNPLNIFFNVLTLSGTVTLSAIGVSGAIVRLINQATDVEIAKTTTDANGAYKFTGYIVVQSVNHHITVEYTNGGTKYNAKSLWDVNPAYV